MRAKQFITESLTTEEVTSVLTQYCQPYLNMVGLDFALKTHPMYSGRKNTVFDQKPYVFRSVNQAREPRDSSQFVHKIADSFFREKFGIPYRTTSMFVNGSYNEAKIYGIPAIVIPVGEFDYCWSPHVEDLYLYTDQAGISNHLNNNNNSSVVNELEEILMHANYQHNKRLQTAIESKNEIMISCKHVALVNPDWVRVYRNALA